MAAPESKIVNGVNVTELVKTIDAVKANPIVAKSRFRVTNEWVDGGHNRTIVNEFQIGQKEVRRTHPFTLEADEPPVLLGSDLGPNPVEYLLTALAACVTTSLIFHAAAMGIVIEEVESTVEGELDSRGTLGIDKNVRNGFQSIRMTFSIRADVSDEQIQQIAQLGPSFSPVFDSITKGVPVQVHALRMGSEHTSEAA